jgi:tetratricopeptide (TPR) repeat protein
MDNERVQFLRNSISVNPGDTFARYALALELTRGGQSGEAWEHFQYLLDHHADYAPTYYQAGNLLANQGRGEEARAVLLRGIEVTRRLGQKHAESELQAALEAVDS